MNKFYLSFLFLIVIMPIKISCTEETEEPESSTTVGDISTILTEQEKSIINQESSSVDQKSRFGNFFKSQSESERLKPDAFKELQTACKLDTSKHQEVKSMITEKFNSIKNHWLVKPILDKISEKFHIELDTIPGGVNEHFEKNYNNENIEIKCLDKSIVNRGKNYKTTQKASICTKI